MKKIPTEIFVTKEESFAVVQFFGIANTARGILQEYLKLLGAKYGFNWQECEIAPSGEVIQVVDDGKKDELTGVS
jgi:hypothetical protein